jgi:hypothetical protein
MSNQLQTVTFAGTDLFIVNQAGKPFVPMRTIVEGMGMDWKSQHEKLKNRFSTCVVEITTQLPNDTQTRSVTCLPLAKIAGWLYSVSPNKVAPEIRDKVIQYQNECDTALFDYWTKGVAINPAIQTNAPYSVSANQTITAEEANILRDLVTNHAKNLPKDKQGAYIMQTWSKLKAHFKVPYREIPQTNFSDAMSLVGRHIALAGAEAAALPAHTVNYRDMVVFFITLLETECGTASNGALMTEHMARLQSTDVTTMGDMLKPIQEAMATFKTLTKPHHANQPANDTHIRLLTLELEHAKAKHGLVV